MHSDVPTQENTDRPPHGKKPQTTLQRFNCVTIRMIKTALLWALFSMSTMLVLIMLWDRPAAVDSFFILTECENKVLLCLHLERVFFPPPPSTAWLVEQGTRQWHRWHTKMTVKLDNKTLQKLKKLPTVQKSKNKYTVLCSRQKLCSLTEVGRWRMSHSCSEI